MLYCTVETEHIGEKAKELHNWKKGHKGENAACDYQYLSVTLQKNNPKSFIIVCV